MKKVITTISAALILTVFANTAFADFPDVADTHKNVTAIEYLKENNVISGYPDGTFKPNKTVNRAEFLKIIIEGSNIATDQTLETPFPDVDHNAWYGPYVKKAYHEGWIIGYTDGKFRPEREISKVEALKIVAKAQKWDTPDFMEKNPFLDVPRATWFARYVEYARVHGYLEETSENYEPHLQATRGGISEVIYRSIIDEDGTVANQTPPVDTTPTDTTTDTPPVDTTPTDTTTDTSTDNLNFTPHSFTTIPTNFFDNITLTSPMPNTFYKGEVYVLNGTVNQNGFKSATAALYDINSTPLTFNESLDSNRNFSIPIYFNHTGNIRFGLLPGDSGSTKTFNISVLPNLPTNTTEETSTNTTSLSVNFQNNKTNVNFATEPSTLEKITFIQNNQKHVYYSRQDLNTLPIQYKDFTNFQAGNVEVKMETAKLSNTAPLKITSDFSSPYSTSFNAIEHSYSLIDKNYITATIPETLPLNSQINFSGSVQRNTRVTAYVIKPDGFTDSFNLQTTSPTGTYFGSSIINNGGNFTYTYQTAQAGRYIIEINDQDGLATANHPIYVGNVIPLIPDYFDTNKRLSLFSGTLNLTNERNALLALINESRQKHGLTPVSLSDELNTLAQNHSQDMATNNYFRHFNLQNQTPDDRRKAANITTTVSENIAKDISVKFAHEGLMRSAAHRENILDPNWERVGLGIALKNGHLYISQEFSTNPLTTEDLTTFKTQLTQEIENKRTQASSPGFLVKSSLELTAKYLNDKSIQEGQSITNELFNEALSANSVTGISQAIGRTSSSWEQSLNSILTDELSTLTDASYESIGIDIQMSAEGAIHTTIILNKAN